jgi:DNA excision repair protein ERCC-3
MQAFYSSAVEFIIAIAEPVSRPRFIHEYVITDVSLHSAVALGLIGSVIVKKLDLLCKTSLPAALVRFITASTRHAGKLRLVLFNSRYSLETTHVQILEDVARLPAVRAMLDGDVLTRSSTPAQLPHHAVPSVNAANVSNTGYLHGVASGLIDGCDAAQVHGRLAWQREFDRDDMVTATTHFAMLLQGKERDVVRTCRELGYPLVEVKLRAAVVICL